MADYWGLRRIADRMDWKYERTPIRQVMSTGFPLYMRRRGTHNMWYCSDELIRIWELTRVKLDREKLLERARSGSKNREASSEG